MNRFTKKLFLLGGLTMFVCMSFIISDKWVTVHVKKYGYQIDFPKKPTEQTQKLNSAAGELQLNMYVYDASEGGDDENLVYISNCTVYPEELKNKFVENMDAAYTQSIEGAVKNVKGKLLSEKKIEIHGYEGREVTIDYQNGLAIITMRMVVVNNNVYMLQTITETTKSPNASAQKFMDSFQLLK